MRTPQPPPQQNACTTSGGRVSRWSWLAGEATGERGTECDGTKTEGEAAGDVRDGEPEMTRLVESQRLRREAGERCEAAEDADHEKRSGGRTDRASFIREDDDDADDE